VKKLSNQTPPSTTDRTEAYRRAWMSAACDVLRQITGAAFAAVDLSPQELDQEVGKLKQEGVWLRFTVGCSSAASPVKGEHSFGIGKADALRFAQILMGEPFDAARDFSADYQDALDELFRQFAGTAALALKPVAGAEVNLQLAGHDSGNWKPSLQWGARLNSEGTAQFLLVILLDPGLVASLTSSFSGKTAPPPITLSMNPPAASKGNRNIDLLLDVELPVALRFGKSEMTLSSILELSAGTVVELDQKILEPVELLVGGKVVAQGEVVVMDGYYALRVTEVLNPMERLESLQAG
jgi:flagellar motor switch protein FliN